MDKSEIKDRERDAKDVLRFIKGQQRMHDGKAQNCPRCGRPALKPELDANPESGQFPIHICLSCIRQEETAKLMKRPDSIKDWKAVTDPRFKVGDVIGGPLYISALHNGMECWGWKYDWPSGLNHPLAAMKPVKGILAERPRSIGNENRTPDWFIPYAKHSRKPAHTKAVRVEGVNVHLEKEAAEEAYDAAVKSIYDRFAGLAEMVRSDMLYPEILDGKE